MLNFEPGLLFLELRIIFFLMLMLLLIPTQLARDLVLDEFFLLKVEGEMGMKMIMKKKRNPDWFDDEDDEPTNDVHLLFLKLSFFDDDS